MEGDVILTGIREDMSKWLFSAAAILSSKIPIVACIVKKKKEKINERGRSESI